ncbi:hypothetical protein E4T56_gene5536, partial [Termitomyces sp. T112]
PRLSVENADAFRWVRAAKGTYDAILIDFPDPTEYSLGKLYTVSFYAQVARLLAPDGVMVVQSTSPLVAPRSFWTVAQTLEAAGLSTRGYHTYVPSFGEWGFTLAAHTPPVAPAHLPDGLRYLNAVSEPLMFDFPPDMARRPTPVNRLDNQALAAPYPGALLGPDMARGHAIRDGKLPSPAGPEEPIPLVIAGGGVAGLAAGWRLAEAGFGDFALFELEDVAGGNARGGANRVTAFPWGAHYLPVPNRPARALIPLLRGLCMITGQDAPSAPSLYPLQLFAHPEARLAWPA